MRQGTIGRRFCEKTQMRTEPRKNTVARKKVVQREVSIARQVGPISDPVCSPNCPDYDPNIKCHNACENAPLRLSSDPDQFPIEKGIAPLVFELKRLGVFYPCWSCEGHNDQFGKPWKNPSVWFYADSVVHVRALSNVIDYLIHTKQLSSRWVVIVTFSDLDNPDTVFSLEPITQGTRVNLSDVQKDVFILSSSIAKLFVEKCDELMKNAG